MSIASASLVPTLPVNGIQFLNSALKSVNLSTDANGNIVGGGGGGAVQTITSFSITQNPSQNITGITPASILQYEVNGNVINFIGQITITINPASSSGVNTYEFSVNGAPVPALDYQNTQIPIYLFAYPVKGGVYNVATPISNTSVFLTVNGSPAKLTIGMTGDVSTFPANTVIIQISGFYFI
jgi:hypothetical protein